MATMQFTRNYTDHSNNSGFQFEFHCDKCGNGFRSSYSRNKLGMATNMLDAASNLLGGGLWGAARGAANLNDALRGKAWDDAFQAAVAEIKPKFRQCRRCGKWVCPEVCWNSTAALCKECAPSLQEEVAAAAAQGAAQQIIAKAGQEAGLIAGIDLTKAAPAACPSCNAPLADGAKFCAGCGKPVASEKKFCAKCGKPSPAEAKFCPECGAPKA
ncbi:MAG: zinc ribbon domain-containing protein [Elusimicrobia bacterium]|nr:zinc ribbon domain-containing protein [Elusimicrobiota bacterium]